MDIFTSHNPILSNPLCRNAFPDTDILNSHREVLAEHMCINDAAAMSGYSSLVAPPPLKTSLANGFPAYQFVHGQVSPLASPSGQQTFDGNSESASWSRSDNHSSSSFSVSEQATQINDASSGYSSHVQSPSTDAASTESPMLLQTTAHCITGHDHSSTYQPLAETSQDEQVSPQGFDHLAVYNQHQYNSPHAFQHFVQGPSEQQHLQGHFSNHDQTIQTSQQITLPFRTEPTFSDPWHPMQHAPGLPVDSSHTGAFFTPQPFAAPTSCQQHQMRQGPYQQILRHSEPHVSMHSWGSGDHTQRAYASESQADSHDLARGLERQELPPAAPHQAVQVQHQAMLGAASVDEIQEQEEQRRKFFCMQQHQTMMPGQNLQQAYHSAAYHDDSQLGQGQQHAAAFGGVQPSMHETFSPQAQLAEAGTPPQQNASGTKRKRANNMTSEQKRDLSLQRNREAAAKCRGKKKERDNATSAECQTLQEHNEILRAQRSQMQSELSTLRDQVLEIAASGCDHELEDISHWISINSKTGGSRFRRLMTDWTNTKELKVKRQELMETDADSAKVFKRMEAEEMRASMDLAPLDRGD